ncbi:MAG TPA: hypothetical protein VK789_28175 [Bryobacteraceae bacterium]|jgi:Holliday junction resolvasome RuvABC endonuclease subunit|nr:hypothetical protein [Bryobacteraceae bacterium]
MATVIGIDLSLSGTGIARYSRNLPGSHFTVNWNVKGTEPHAPANMKMPDHLWQCERQGQLLTFIKDFIGDEMPDLVVVEDVYRGKSGSATLDLAQLAGLVRYWLHTVKKAPFALVVGQASKKFAGLPGSKEGQSRPKGLICKYVQSSFGQDIDDDNCADAVTMAYMGAAILSLWPVRTKYQQDVISGLIQKSPWLRQLSNLSAAAAKA